MNEHERHFYEIQVALQKLIDTDPQLAIRTACELDSDPDLEPENIDMIKAGILVDAGAAARDGSAIDEGVLLFRRLHEKLPTNGVVTYNLANGLMAQADRVGRGSTSWYLDTMDIRREARRLFLSAAYAPSTPANVSAEALTNLANALLRAYRYIEAYDSYSQALEFDHTNGIALTGAAKVLLWLAQAGRGDPKTLFAVAAKHLNAAKENQERIREIAGEQAYNSLSDLLRSDIPVGKFPDLTEANPYQRFVAKHRISLSPTIEGLDLSLSHWDSIRIETISEPLSTGPGVPPLFAMFNVLKSDFLTARYLAYSALNNTIPESGKYSDSLDYACYGVRESGLTLAQRACLDILDKVAVAATEYFGMKDHPRGISFTRRWFSTRNAGQTLRWQPLIEKGISRGNTALIAISELSGDLAAGGFLEKKRSIRNSSTHRFTILHDLGGKPERASAFIDHYSFEAFEKQLIETLQLTRAAIHYFVDLVALEERVNSGDGSLGVPLLVPDHHWIRGEN